MIKAGKLLGNPMLNKYCPALEMAIKLLAIIECKETQDKRAYNLKSYALNSGRPSGYKIYVTLIFSPNDLSYLILSSWMSCPSWHYDTTQDPENSMLSVIGQAMSKITEIEWLDIWVRFEDGMCIIKAQEK